MSTATIARKTASRAASAARSPASKFMLAKRRAAAWCQAAECERLDIVNDGGEFFALIEVSVDKYGETRHTIIDVKNCKLDSESHRLLVAHAALDNRFAKQKDESTYHIVCRVGIFYAE